MGITMENLTILIPFWNGHKLVRALLNSIPQNIPIIVIDDYSDAPYQSNRQNLSVIRPLEKGYFTGAVNAGIDACKTDVLIVNQDAHFVGTQWLDFLAKNRNTYPMIGERIGGNHPAWPDGYIHGTFMYLRRDVIDKVGKLNARDYPLWGSTCEYQLRVHRAGYKPLAARRIPGFIHDRGKRAYGDSITEMLQRHPENKAWYLHTPPEISVIIPCYNQGRFLKDAINSLIGGHTSLGDFPPQTFQSFEAIIVDDQSPDDTQKIGMALADAGKGIRYIRRKKNGGTSAANNSGIRVANGRFITILCADDMMEPDRLETLYRAAMTDPSKVYYDDITTFTDGTRRDPMVMNEYNFDRLLYKNQMHCGIFFERRAWERVGGYPEEMIHGREDWAMNIRLGANGYCGKHIKYKGYLYRRQDHNRTLINTTPTWRAKFLAQLQSLYPELYNGSKRNPMCCGSDKPTKTTKPTTKRSATIVPMSDGAVVLEYIGPSFGTQTFYGPKTGARYKAGKSRNLISVDPRDLATGDQNKRGLLELIENGQKLFRRYVQPVAQVEPSSDIEAAAGLIIETSESKTEIQQTVSMETPKEESKDEPEETPKTDDPDEAQKSDPESESSKTPAKPKRTRKPRTKKNEQNS